MALARDRDSSISITPTLSLWAGDPGIRSISSRARDFFLFHSILADSGSHLALSPRATGDLSSTWR
jgi:hypothetical protein